MNKIGRIFAWGCGGILAIGVGLPVMVDSCSKGITPNKKENPSFSDSSSEGSASRESKITRAAEPYAYKDFQLGMSLEAWKHKARNYFQISKTRKYYKGFIISNSTIANTHCTVGCYFEDYGDGLILDRIEIVEVKKSAYPDIKNAFIAKFGQPSATKNVVKTNAFGATLNGEEISWDNNISSIDINEIGDTYNESEITMDYHDPIHRKSKDTSEQENKAKGDI